MHNIKVLGESSTVEFGQVIFWKAKQTFDQKQYTISLAKSEVVPKNNSPISKADPELLYYKEYCKSQKSKIFVFILNCQKRGIQQLIFYQNSAYIT